MKPEIKVDYYSNGQKWYEEHYANGQLHGLCTGWHSNGKKKYEHHYANGKLHGPQFSE